MDTFTWKPISGTMKPTIKALNRQVEFEDGGFQTQEISENSTMQWEFDIGGTKKDYSDFVTFFNAHAPGQQTFYWYEPFTATPTKYLVVFDSDSFTPTNYYGYDTDNNTFSYVGFKWTCKLRRVYDDA